MPYISEAKLREMKAILKRARKNVEQHEQWIAEIKRMREEQEKRILRENYD